MASCVICPFCIMFVWIVWQICPASMDHRLRMPRGNSLHCTGKNSLPPQPNFSDIFDLCLHWVSVVFEMDWLVQPRAILCFELQFAMLHMIQKLEMFINGSKSFVSFVIFPFANQTRGCNAQLFAISTGKMIWK